jgi:phosphonate transport system ATP-binding protein
VSAPLRVTNLTKSYPNGKAILTGVDMYVPAGEIVALVGSNGAGKSTLLRAVVRLVEPTAGTIHIGNADVTAAGRGELRAVRRRVGFVFQKFQLVPRLDALANVLHGALGRSGPRGWWSASASDGDRAEAMSCLDRVGMAAFASQRADTLSGGQQQRVAIARMLMQRPDLVLADEPVASLDPAAGLAVMELLREVATERGLTVVVALHQLDFARRFSDRIVGLREGRVVIDDQTSCCGQNRLEDLYSFAL